MRQQNFRGQQNLIGIILLEEGGQDFVGFHFILAFHFVNLFSHHFAAPDDQRLNYGESQLVTVSDHVLIFKRSGNDFLLVENRFNRYDFIS